MGGGINGARLPGLASRVKRPTDICGGLNLIHLREKTVRAHFGKGFGGQRPIFLPDLNMVIVLTGWNILPGQPFLHAMKAVERVTAAVVD